MTDEPILEVKQLSTWLFGTRSVAKAVDDVSFTVHEGQTFGLVGESGWGKTMTCLSILRLVPYPGRIVRGDIRYCGSNLLRLSEGEMTRVRGRDISMIMQDPMTSLDPVFPIGDQIGEPLKLHRGLRGKEVAAEAARLLKALEITAADTRLRQYPHQLSGGIRQRVAGAIALSCRPKLLIADEPTTSLDVTVQRAYLTHLRRLQRNLGFGMIFVTHNLGIVSQVCDVVGVMYAGKLIEVAPVARFMQNPRHPYSRALLRCSPGVDSVESLPLIPGQPPSLYFLPPGCSFAPRCPEKMPRCEVEFPPLTETDSAWARCWKYQT